MKNRRYVLVIMDSTGRWVRRVGVSRRYVEVVVAGVIAAVLLALVVTAHGMLRYGDAREALLLRQENAQLGNLLAELNDRLPSLRRAALRADASFEQLWSKSHLGVEPTLLAVGPTEEDGISVVGLGDGFSDLLTVEPIALPLEVERVDEDGTRIQYELSELLEYFHDADKLLQHTPSVRPTKSRWLTSPFGRRHDPIHKNSLFMHKGLDLGGQVGMEIFSPADGVVIFTGRRGGYGITVVLHHGFGIQTHFAHLSRYLVQVGDRVQRGQVIGLMGSTGKSTGPHLHYEVRRNGRPLDPAPFILD